MFLFLGFGILATALFFMTSVSKAASLGLKGPLPRGIRNNNPGNIRYLSRNAFNGQIGDDNGYGIYDTPQNGVRALGKQLDVYGKRGLNTVEKIITTWAPSHENPTDSYVTNVARELNVNRKDVITISSFKAALARAIIRQENGYVPAEYDINKWVVLP